MARSIDIAHPELPKPNPRQVAVLDPANRLIFSPSGVCIGFRNPPIQLTSKDKESE
jgi:hypothetical protein